MRTAVLIALALALVAGCAPVHEDPVETSEAPIVNGSLESGFPSTVSMGGEIGGYLMSMCTGNLITPEIVLCAGHCGDGIPIELIVGLGQAFFGDDIQSYDEAIGFVDFEVHPDYVPLESGLGGTLGEYDLSVFVLAEPATAEPTWFNRDPITDDELDRDMMSVGFGVTGPEGDGSGTKRSALLTLDEYDDNFLISNSSSNPDEANVCSGDSGGPQFFEHENGRWIEAAVHSWADQFCEVQSGSTRTDIAADWILDWVEDVHGSRDVCEINEWYEDGICDDYCDEEDPDCVEPGDDDDDDDDTSGGDDDDAESEADDDDDDGEGGCECSSASERPVGAAALTLGLGLLVVRRR